MAADSVCTPRTQFGLLNADLAAVGNICCFYTYAVFGHRWCRAAVWITLSMSELSMSDLSVGGYIGWDMLTDIGDKNDKAANLLHMLWNLSVFTVPPQAPIELIYDI